MNPCFKLKGSLFSFSVLQLLSSDLKKIEQELKAKIKLAPKFFDSTPMIIDVKAIAETEIDLAKLKKLLLAHHIIPIGIRGVGPEIITTVHKLDLPVFADAKNENDAKDEPASSSAGTKIITTPVRSGQRVYAEGGDLIITSSVSSGAEILAEGNIHVYGTLRGRALAGLNGNEKARVFCQQLSAELVSIAGEYKLFENSAEYPQGLTQVYLEEGKLIVNRL